MPPSLYNVTFVSWPVVHLEFLIQLFLVTANIIYWHLSVLATPSCWNLRTTESLFQNTSNPFLYRNHTSHWTLSRQNGRFWSPRFRQYSTTTLRKPLSSYRLFLTSEFPLFHKCQKSCCVPLYTFERLTRECTHLELCKAISTWNFKTRLFWQAYSFLKKRSSF